jgi:hypothetical protein
MNWCIHAIGQKQSITSTGELVINHMQSCLGWDEMNNSLSKTYYYTHKYMESCNILLNLGSNTLSKMVEIE